MDKETMFLVLGLAMVFIGVFGGGFEIKQIKIPKVNHFSRVVGFFIGVLLVLLSQNILFDFIKTSNAKELKKDIVDADQSKVEKKFNELELAWGNEEVDNDLLLEGYKKLQDPSYQDFLGIQKISQIKRRISDLESSISNYMTLKKKDENKNQTVSEKLDLWESHNIARLSKVNSKFIEEQITKYKKMEKNYASVKSNNFLTCKKVENKNPVGITNNFSAGSVWIWTRINAPKNETLKLEWFNPQENIVMENKTVKVSKNLGEGYRTYYSKRFDEGGTYEVRLYNQEQHLIARNEFQIAE
jgi:hypothetical protein